jgi:tetratricopeptide (TPR) repeat protein
LDNLVTACRRAVAVADAADASACLCLAWAGLRLTGPFALGVVLADEVLALPQLQGAAAAGAFWVAGCAWHKTGEHGKALSRIEGGLAAMGPIDDALPRARLMCALGDIKAALGERTAAEQILGEAEVLARRAESGQILCDVLNAAGALAFDMGSTEAAREKYTAGLEQAEKLNAPRGQSGFLGNLGFLHYAEGRLPEARHAYERALALTKNTGDRQWEANTRCNLGLIFHDLGQSAQARSELTLALVMARAMGHCKLEYVVECNLGIVCEALGSLDDARAHFAAAVAGAQASRDVRSEGQFRGYLGLTLARLGHFETARQCLRLGRELLGRAQDPVNLGLLLCHEAEAEAASGNRESATSALVNAHEILVSRGLDTRSELGRRVAQARKSLDQAVR